jgi:hypothetical protein
MKKYIIIIWINLMALSSQAQLCFERNDTTALDNWNWRTRRWAVFAGGNTGVKDSVLAPPFQGDNPNIGPLTNWIHQSEIDWQPDDGWVLIKRKIGVSMSNYIDDNPYWVFYNKYTARLRVFFLILKNDRGDSSIDPDKGAFIRVRFVVASGEPKYQSNLLTLQNNEQYPLDKFNRDMTAIVPNAYASSDAYWLYADFAVAYDPCTCLNNGKLLIETVGLKEGEISININSLPYAAPVQNSQVKEDRSMLGLIGNLSEQVSGAVKVGTNLQEAISQNE